MVQGVLVPVGGGGGEGAATELELGSSSPPPHKLPTYVGTICTPGIPLNPIRAKGGWFLPALFCKVNSS
jgi:hypothetical protein